MCLLSLNTILVEAGNSTLIFAPVVSELHGGRNSHPGRGSAPKATVKLKIKTALGRQDRVIHFLYLTETQSQPLYLQKEN